MNSIEIAVFSQPGLEARKSGMAKAINRPNLSFALSPKCLSNGTKIYIFITRIPWVVYIIFLEFSKNSYLQASALNNFFLIFFFFFCYKSFTSLLAFRRSHCCYPSSSLSAIVFISIQHVSWTFFFREPSH